MAKTFLERARELVEREREWDEDPLGPPNLADEIMRQAGKLRVDCWPEILAVVEAARKCAPMLPQATSEHSQNVVELDKALDALDRKAGE